tara:strand:+ start:127 stop:1869 length:1743 start_codon:yes stop_codon:yes gene_type:complete
MSFSKTDLDEIKSKISLKNEIEKKTKLIKKGKDYWCCCPFHEEKTPSCKVNDEQGTFYCFGCSAKGDIFTIYTDLYNYKFQDAVKELAQRIGIKIELKDIKISKEQNLIKDILEESCNWFQNNLKNEKEKYCINYLKSRNVSEEIIENFRLGFSFNIEKNLFDYLKEMSFSEKDIIKSNVVKIDKNNRIKDYFYKRLIFPIMNEGGQVVGFGGRSLGDTNPKYINSPESTFFQKRKILYNLSQAKSVARKKNNLLICEGYMDVISLYQRGIKSVVAPLGTALTEEQLNLAWRYSTKPTIMFDGDKAGLRASFKSALMALPLLTSKNFLQFINLDEGYDPDSFINNFSFNSFLKIIKKPKSLINFVFEESSRTISLDNADQKVSFDKYLDDIINMIKDKKIKYFYKNEFKSLFFNRLKNNSLTSVKNIKPKKINTPLIQKQIFSFIASCINHPSIRKQLINELLNISLLDEMELDFLHQINEESVINKNRNEIIKFFEDTKWAKFVEECTDTAIYQLFPYSSTKFDAQKSLEEIIESCKNLNTRLLKLKKINKSLNSFVKDSTQLNWEELQGINSELYKDS